ncbi:MAG: serpin family protein, partial [Cyanobacteria bacterium P01_G01_bin.49]
MRTKRTTKALVGFIFLFFLSGLVSFSKTRFLSILADAQELQEVSPRMILPKQSWDERLLVKAQTQFGFKLFSTLATTSDQPQNIFISPTGITFTLSMLYNGATEKTQQEIATLLGIRGVNINALNRANRALKTDLNNHSPQVSLTMVDSLWARQGFSFRYKFLKKNQHYYNSQITNLNFSSDEASRIINGWAKENTQGKIHEIINQVRDEDVLLLTNASYFQGNWQTGFDENLTEDKPFYRPGKKAKNSPFMSRQGTYHYLETPQLQSVKLPYGEGRFSFYVVLPKQDQSLSEILHNLTVSKWKNFLSKFREQKGLVQ